MLQRAFDACAAANPAGRLDIETFARAIGADPLPRLSLAGRLERRDFRPARGAAAP
jgi:hypothetical protein